MTDDPVLTVVHGEMDPAMCDIVSDRIGVSLPIFTGITETLSIVSRDSFGNRR